MKVEPVVAKRRAANQVRVNDLYYHQGPAKAEAMARHIAQTELIERWQYNHYDGPEWVLAQVSDIVEGRAGVYAQPGDIVLVHQETAGVVSFYSVRMACNCVAGAGIRPLMGWDQAFALWALQFPGPLAGTGRGTFIARAAGNITK